MCGIAGFISLDQTLANGEKVLKCMGELLAHRGPDGEGTWMDDSLARSGWLIADFRSSI